MRFAAKFAAVLAFAVPMMTQSAIAAPTETAVFAGGCFWCIEQDFEKLEGVGDVVSGYAGGSAETATYAQVTKADTGHYEVVRVPYDPDVVSYGELVDYFFRHIDPTDARGQFCDKGPSYRSAIFATPEQRAEAEAGLERARAALGLDSLATPVIDAVPFYLAEDYHQDYAKKKPARYKLYRTSCGRDRRVRQIWSNAS